MATPALTLVSLGNPPIQEWNLSPCESGIFSAFSRPKVAQTHGGGGLVRSLVWDPPAFMLQLLLQAQMIMEKAGVKTTLDWWWSHVMVPLWDKKEEEEKEEVEWHIDGAFMWHGSTHASGGNASQPGGDWDQCSGVLPRSTVLHGSCRRRHHCRLLWLDHWAVQQSDK